MKRLNESIGILHGPSHVHVEYAVLSNTAKQLHLALARTLGLDEHKIIFVGNEEKFFLLYLESTLLKVDLHSLKVCQTMYDVIHLANQSNRDPSELTSNHFPSPKITFVRRLMEASSRALEGAKKWKRSVRLLYSLKKRGSLIHYAAHLRSAPFVIHSLTRSLVHFPAQNTQLRRQFDRNLESTGILNPLRDALVKLFPISHLEGFWYLENHKLAKANVKTVCTSIYGIMIDPLLGAMVRKSGAYLVYVQHGGNYGFSDEIIHFIEATGADKMLYWGVGENNVLPTRYALQPCTTMCKKIYIVLGPGVPDDEIIEFIAILQRIEKASGIAGIVVAHPVDRVAVALGIQSGIDLKAHESACMVVYDSIAHSLIYARVLVKRPFIVLESAAYLPRHAMAAKWIELMRGSGLMISRDALEDKLINWLVEGGNVSDGFEKIASPVLEHILSNPRLEDLYP